MTTPAHLVGGYGILSVSKRWWGKDLPVGTVKGLMVFGVGLSVLIDLDVLWAGGIGGHHELVTHYPAFWVVVSGLIYGLGVGLGRPGVRALAVVTLMAAMLHMLMDTVGVTMGIWWLWPFVDHEFSVTPLTRDFASEQARLDYILRSPIVWVGDGLVIGLGLVQGWKDWRSRFRDG